MRAHPRIAVVGTSGAGKTTFSKRLAELLAREHVELDALHWGPSWTPRPDFVERVREAAARDQWVIEGNYREVRDVVWQRATALVWLNYSFPVVFARALARTVRRVLAREPLYAGNRESIGRAFFDLEGIPWWVIRTYRRRRREYGALLRDPRYAHLTVFELRKPDEASALLRSAA